MQSSMELRKARSSLDYVASLLDTNECWKIVMSYIPKDLQNDNYLSSDQYERKYNNEHVRLIEEHAHSEKMSYTKVLFDEWGSSGHIRPTLQTLMIILTKSKMFRAADNLANLLSIPPPPRPSEGPGAPVNVTDYLNNLTSEHLTETRMLPNGITNGTDDAVCNGPTKKLDPSIQLMHFPPTENISTNSVPIPVLDGIETVMIANDKAVPGPSEVSDFMKFTKEEPTPLSSSQYLPHFSELVKTETSKQDSSISALSDSEISESSQSQSDVTSQSHQMQSSLPSNAVLHRFQDQVDRDILQDQSLIAFKYSELENITGKFGDKVGGGGFGDIFKGFHRQHGLLAIKRSHGMHQQDDLIMKMFNTEVISLSVLRHENIVHIVGYSLDGPAPCIVCEFIQRGSLLECLKIEQNLDITKRINIMKGTAEGLRHIHNTEKPRSTLSGSIDMNAFRKQYFVHGDVKSANILITQDFVPKICDLGLSKHCDTTFQTRSIMGTMTYMSHERLSGTITPKGDTYSYGIVLLELLTGLPPDNIASCDGNYDIKTYIDEKCQDGNIERLLDQKVGAWPSAQKIFSLAKRCLKYDRNKRPTMSEICDILEEISKTD